MGVLWAVSGVIGLAVLAWLVWRRRRASDSERPERPVLPAHYSSLLETDPTRYPGLCPDCGAENTPGYNFCRECGEQLPGGTQSMSEPDVSQMFGE